MISRLRHSLVLILFVLLPFHALFVTVGTRVLFGPGHAPEPLLAIWKELLIIVIFVCGILELWRKEEKTIMEIVRKHLHWTIVLEREKAAMLLLLAIAIVFFPSTDLETFLYGFRYLFVPLIFFAMLRTLQWDEDFLLKRVFPVLAIVSSIIVVYGLLTIVLPMSFFSALGYSDAHSLYSPNSPLSAFQMISDSGIRRIQSTFSGPNQFGMWLLIPWSIGCVQLLSKERKVLSGTSKIPHFQFSCPSLPCWQAGGRRAIFNFHLVAFLLIGAALFLTFSRSAWIAAFVIAVTACFLLLDRGTRQKVLLSCAGVALLSAFILSVFSPQLFLRSISNKHHLERVRDGVIAMIQRPFGHGLGTAGPATNRTHDACMYFEEGADYSWARERDDLCIFVGETQVQPSPSRKVCSCPILPENWYLQIGYELGVAGFLLFVMLVFYLVKRLAALGQKSGGSYVPFLSFLGISIAAFFLHAWEDSAVAYTVWGMAGVVLSEKSMFGQGQEE